MVIRNSYFRVTIFKLRILTKSSQTPYVRHFSYVKQLETFLKNIWQPIKIPHVISSKKLSEICLLFARNVIAVLHTTWLRRRYLLLAFPVSA